jgi:hypothetical protein
MVNIVKRGVQIVKIGAAARKLKNSQGEVEKQLARRALANLFADARGGVMKIGQLMAGPDDDNPFVDLATGIEPLPLADMIPVIEEGLGCSLSDVFSEIDESDAAASLGQVHHARLKDGIEVAIKVQYPGIDKAVAAELTLAGLMPGIGPVRKWGFDLAGYKTALKENMDRELDYRNEAARQIRYRAQVTVPGLVVPAVYEELTSKRVLVQEWRTGGRFTDLELWTQKDRDGVGRVLLATLFKSLFDAGEVHGDPHPGNSCYLKSPKGDPLVVLMDYGCTAPVSQQQRLALLKLILSLRGEAGAVSSLRAFAAMGFDAEKLSAIGKAMPQLAEILLAPFLADRPFKITEWNLKTQFEALLGENRWWFRAAGAPGDILLLRAFQGVVQQLDQLSASLDWMKTLRETVSTELLERAKKFTLPPLPVGVREFAPTPRTESTAPLADHLRVEVHEGNKRLVSVTMPAAAAMNLRDLVPEDVLALIEAADDIDLDAILERLAANGLQPQDILTFDKPPKRYRIWLA